MPTAHLPVPIPLRVLLHDVTIPMTTAIETTIAENGVHHIECDLCGRDCSLTITTDTFNFQRHRGSKKCINLNKKRLKEAAKSLDGQFVNYAFASSTDEISPLPAISATLSVVPPAVIGTRQPTEPCPGLDVKWEYGSIWLTYPYQTHISGLVDLGWKPISVQGNDNVITLRSDKCTSPDSGGDGFTCHQCTRIVFSDNYEKFCDRAVEVESNTPWDYLSPIQTKQAMLQLHEDLSKLRREVLQLRQAYHTQGQKLDDYHRVLILLATNNVPRLRELLAVALQNGVSMKAIVLLLNDALQGLYTPHADLTQRDWDIAFLVKAIGGPRLLYALQHSHGFPSISTLRRKHPMPSVLPSIGVPIASEINTNIDRFMDPSIKPPPHHPTCSLPGQVLMIDGVALDTRIRYCPTRNAMLGFGREHIHQINPIFTDMSSVDAVCAALYDPENPSEQKVFLGSDATVAALAPVVAGDHYSACPIVLSPSDKTEKGAQLAAWLTTVLNCWKVHESGQKTHGAIWAIASDGDSTFRMAKHAICMQLDSNPASLLGSLLHRLPGLNLFTSKDGVLGTCNFKHVIKRFATLLRNNFGIVVGDIHISGLNIANNLRSLPDLSEERINALLNPSDKQNVPNAIELIERLGEVPLLPPPQPLHPPTLKQRKHIGFVAEFMGYFVDTFVNTNLSLSEQIQSLSVYSHLAAAMAIRHGTSFLTGALYSDSQSIIKNIVYTTARLQVLNPTLLYHIVIDGTDRLENLFGNVRTQDHSCNFDTEQLGGKLGAAALISSIFERHPDLDQGHRRIDLLDKYGVDHVNPASWNGNVCVGDVNLEQEWRLGSEKANMVLEQYFGEGAREDFAARFMKADCDLLRPQGRYIGIGLTLDPQSMCSDDTAMVLSEALNDARSEDESISTQLPISGLDDPEMGLDIVDYISPMDNDPEQDHQPLTFSKTIDIDGRTFFKTSIVATLNSNRAKKVTVRSLRAYGLSHKDMCRPKKNEAESSRTLDEGDVMKEGDLAAILIRSAGQVCLAVVEVKSFRYHIVDDATKGKGKSDAKIKSSAPLADLHKTHLKITVTAQVINLEESSNDGHNWRWTGQYVQLYPVADKSPLTAYHFTLQVPSTAIYPLAPNVAMIQDLRQPATWVLPTMQLDESLSFIWNALESEREQLLGNLQLLPNIRNSAELPYRKLSPGPESGDMIASLPMFVVHNEVLEGVLSAKLSPKEKVDCSRCGDEVVLSQMRNHVGSHILRADRFNETNPLPAEPCGFCGAQGCLIQLNCKTKKKGNSTEIAYSVLSNCCYHYAGMNYKKAKEYSNATLCTNVPIFCSLCPTSPSGQKTTIWKYNAMYHIIVKHSLMEGKVPQVPGNMLLDIFVSRQEEKRLGVQEQQTTVYRSRHALPESDGLEAYMDVVSIEKKAEAIKRGRASSMATQASSQHSRAHVTKKSKW